MKVQSSAPDVVARPSDGLTLRERTRAAMRAEVVEVAFQLFAEQGYESTTVDQIAASAGLSRTTFFRYFGTKEELVLGKVNEFGVGIRDALAARPPEEAPWEALRRAFDVMTMPRSHDAGPELDTIQLLTDACSLMTKAWDKTQGWQSIIAPQMSQRLGGPSVKVDLRARVLTAAAIACLDAATDAWIAAKGSLPLAVLLDDAMDALSDSVK